MLNFDYVSDQGWWNATTTYRVHNIGVENSDWIELLPYKLHKRDLFPFRLRIEEMN